MQTQIHKNKLTILGVAIVDVTVTERSSAGQVPANPNRHDLAQLIEQVIQL